MERTGENGSVDGVSREQGVAGEQEVAGGRGMGEVERATVDNGRERDQMWEKTEGC